MNALSFTFEASPESNDDQVRPCVDGVDLVQKISHDSLGLDPPEFFRQSALLSGGEILIGRCSCGVVGCGDVGGEVSIKGKEVQWWFGEGLEYVFELGAYQLAVRNAAECTSWESVSRTAERLVRKLDFRKLAAIGLEFQWASARITPGFMTLSFDRKGGQELFNVPWDGQHPAGAREQVRKWIRDF